MPRPNRFIHYPATTLLAALLSTSAYAEQESMEEDVVQGKYLSIDQVDSVKTTTPIIDVPKSL